MSSSNTTSNPLFLRARILAAKLHEKQRYQEHPYTYHLNAVEQVLRRVGCTDDNFLAAAQLHDAIEDTWYSKSQCARDFNDRVAELVYAVTNEKGRNRHERHRLTYPKIIVCDGGIVVKLADRIANVEACRLFNNKGLLAMYREENGPFSELVASSMDNTNMKQTLWDEMVKTWEVCNGVSRSPDK